MEYLAGQRERLRRATNTVSPDGRQKLGYYRSSFRGIQVYRSGGYVFVASGQI